MTKLKLTRLPDRTPVKITITLASELNKTLRDYAAIYRKAYGESETVSELIPYMLEAFLESDRAFAKAQKEGLSDAGTTNLGGGSSNLPRRAKSERE